jgi:hypothetical protein
MMSVCPQCGHCAPFRQVPLWWLAGSAGSGKSVLAPRLRALLPGWVVFEGEAIDFWRFEGAAPDDYSSLHNQWLKVAYEIAVNGPPVLMIATVLPEQLDACTYRNRFSVIHYRGLVCAPEEQARRLRARPAWRRAADPASIARAQSFTARLRALAAEDAAVTLEETDGATPDESARRIAAWVVTSGEWRVARDEG